MDYRIEQLRHQLREDPSSRVFYQLGELLRRSGELPASVEALRAGLEHHPRYVAAWVSLGRGLLQQEDWSGAEVAFARALELDPENAVAARMIGEAAIGRGDLLRAVKAFKLARALSPRDPSLEEQIASVEAQLEEQGLLEAATPKPPPAIAPHYFDHSPAELAPPEEPDEPTIPPVGAPFMAPAEVAEPVLEVLGLEELEEATIPPVGAQYIAPLPSAAPAAEEPQPTAAAEPAEATPEPEPSPRPLRCGPTRSSRPSPWP